MENGNEDLSKEQMEMLLGIFDSGMIGYAYLTPQGGGAKQEFVLSTTAENLAAFLGQHQFDASEIIITDMLDRLTLNTFGGFINQCPNQHPCREIVKQLAPIQMGEKEAGKALVMEREAFERFAYMEDQKVTEAELTMM